MLWSHHSDVKLSFDYTDVSALSVLSRSAAKKYKTSQVIKLCTNVDSWQLLLQQMQISQYSANNGSSYFEVKMKRVNARDMSKKWTAELCTQRIESRCTVTQFDNETWQNVKPQDWWEARRAYEISAEWHDAKWPPCQKTSLWGLQASTKWKKKLCTLKNKQNAKN